MKTNGRTDSIDALLASDAELRIEDNGFTARVIASLPRRAATSNPLLQPALVLGATVTGAAIATFVAPVGPTLAAGFADLVTLQAASPAAIAALLAAISLALAAWILVDDAG
jgi:hypothetical protein